MAIARPSLRSAADRLAALPSFALFCLLYTAVALSHATLLRLPYFWDEAGYYIPAALDFYHDGALIPQFTNAHPPLPNVLLGTFWRLAGFHVLGTRLLVCAIAAGALLAVFRLAEELLNSSEQAWAVCLLTGLYSIWYVQSSLAHADIFATLFTLWALVFYFRWPVENPERPQEPKPHGRLEYYSLLAVPALFSLAALAKETSIVQPVALAAYEGGVWLADMRARKRCGEGSLPAAALATRLHRVLALSFPLLPLLAWFAYHRVRTGFTFGNPEFLRYNATANFTAGHIANALRYRLMHLAWQREMWIPLSFTLVCLLLTVRKGKRWTCGLPAENWRVIGVLIAANWIAFSILGGALLTRYLLPVYPLLLLLCVAVWRATTRRWPWFTGFTAVAFVSAWWISPPSSFAPEDNLTYRDMILVHQDAIRFTQSRYPEATVLTAWPVAMDLLRPEIGYLKRPMHVTTVENFTREQIRRAAQEPDKFDTALVFPTHYTTPSLQQYFSRHPQSSRAQDYFAHRDLAAGEVARLLGGRVVWQENRNGEWAAVLRFPRSYQASKSVPKAFPSMHSVAGVF